MEIIRTKRGYKIKIYESIENDTLLNEIDDITNYIDNKFNQSFEKMFNINYDPQVTSFNECLVDGLLSKELQHKASEIREQSYMYEDTSFEYNGKIL